MFCEVLLETNATGQAGPCGSKFRAAAGELKQHLHSLELEHYFEGTVIDPDGREANIAQAIARRIKQ